MGFIFTWVYLWCLLTVSDVSQGHWPSLHSADFSNDDHVSFRNVIRCNYARYHVTTLFCSEFNGENNGESFISECYLVFGIRIVKFKGRLANIWLWPDITWLNIELELNTYYQSQGLVKSNQQAFSSKLCDAYFRNKRQQFSFRAVKGSKVASWTDSLSWNRSSCRGGSRHSQICYEVSNINQRVSLCHFGSGTRRQKKL